MKLIPLEGRGNEYLKRPVGSDVIWVDRYKKGFKRLQQSLRTENPLEARKKRDDKFIEWFGETPKVAKKVKQLNGDLFPIWVKTKASKSDATKDSIKYSSQHFLPFIQDMYPDQINESWWLNTYIPAKLLEKSDRKFYNEWKWLTSYLKYLHRQGQLGIMPALKCPDKAPAEGLNLEAHEIQALYNYGNGDLSLQIDLGFKHFLRRSEVLLMPYAEIDFKAGVLHLPKERTKIRKKRDVPLNQETLTALKARKEASNSAWVFPSPLDKHKSISRTGNDTAWKNAIARANEDGDVVIRPEATFHDLRHSGLSRAFVATNRYAEICVMAGLSLEEAQKTYLHLKPEHTRFVSELVKIEDSNVD